MTSGLIERAAGGKAMTDTAELIAALKERAYLKSAGNTLIEPEQLLEWHAATALAAQVQEVDDNKIKFGEAFRVEVLRAEAAEARVAQLDKDWRSISEELCTAEARCNAAEARVRWLEGQLSERNNEMTTVFKQCDAEIAAARAERDAIEAETIERATEALKTAWVGEATLDDLIRALRHIGKRP